MRKVVLVILAPDGAALDDIAAVLRTTADEAASKISATEHVSDLYERPIGDPDLWACRLAPIPLA